jgi:hypothetical protein
MAGGRTMTEAEWLGCGEPKALLGLLIGKVSDRKMRLFACVIARQCPTFAADNQRTRGVEVAERFSDGMVTDDEREAARVDLQLRMEEEIVQQDFERACRTRDAKRCLDHVQREWFHVIYDHRSWSPEDTGLIRDIFGNPFRPVVFSPEWRTNTALALARQIYESRDFGAMPILADALQDAGCDSDDILGHCRGDGPHVRGCWVIDLVLGKE